MAKNYWAGIKRRSKLSRRRRRAAADGLLPAVRAICERAGIAINSTPHGWQFRKNEYIINWHPSSNKVRIQYTLKGDGKTVPFDKSDPEKPRVILALEELIEITRACNG